MRKEKKTSTNMLERVMHVLDNKVAPTIHRHTQHTQAECYKMSEFHVFGIKINVCVRVHRNMNWAKSQKHSELCAFAVALHSPFVYTIHLCRNDKFY